MDNAFDQINTAISQAKDTLKAADAAAGTMARLLLGRLHHVSNEETLVLLKRELQGFDAHTKVWKK